MPSDASTDTRASTTYSLPCSSLGDDSVQSSQQATTSSSSSSCRDHPTSSASSAYPSSSGGEPTTSSNVTLTSEMVTTSELLTISDAPATTGNRNQSQGGGEGLGDAPVQADALETTETAGDAGGGSGTASRKDEGRTGGLGAMEGGEKELSSADQPGPSACSTSKDCDVTEMGGACGGTSRPRTVMDVLNLQGGQQMYAVQPLTWCPHLDEVRPLPPAGLRSHDACSTCGDSSENWVCLTCYQVECSRFVQEHMLFHRLTTEHNLVLSYSDISVWCYACDHYIDHSTLYPMKNAAHISKFGEPLPAPLGDQRL